MILTFRQNPSLCLFIHNSGKKEYKKAQKKGRHCRPLPHIFLKHKLYRFPLMFRLDDNEVYSRAQSPEVKAGPLPVHEYSLLCSHHLLPVQVHYLYADLFIVLAAYLQLTVINIGVQS